MKNQNKIRITQLVNQYTDELFLWASYKVSDTEQAKDLIQDTFLAAAEKNDSSTQTGWEKPGGFGILKTCCHFDQSEKSPEQRVCSWEISRRNPDEKSGKLPY